MSSEPARYDALVDQLIEFTRDWESEPIALLPGDLRGLRVLDLALFEEFAERGSSVPVTLIARCRRQG